MVRTKFFLLFLLFIGVVPLSAQTADEISRQQKGVIKSFYKLFSQDSSVTLTQAYEVFYPQDLWNIESYTDNSDTLKSLTFQRIRSLKPYQILPFEASSLKDSSRITFNWLLIDQVSNEGNIQKNSYRVMVEKTINWSIIFEFYGHPYQYISKIILNDGTDILEKIGLSK